MNETEKVIQKLLERIASLEYERAVLLTKIETNQREEDE